MKNSLCFLCLLLGLSTSSALNGQTILSKLKNDSIHWQLQKRNLYDYSLVSIDRDSNEVDTLWKEHLFLHSHISSNLSKDYMTLVHQTAYEQISVTLYTTKDWTYHSSFSLDAFREQTDFTYLNDTSISVKAGGRFGKHKHIYVFQADGSIVHYRQESILMNPLKQNEAIRAFLEYREKSKPIDFQKWKDWSVELAESQCDTIENKLHLESCNYNKHAIARINADNSKWVYQRALLKANEKNDTEQKVILKYHIHYFSSKEVSNTERYFIFQNSEKKYIVVHHDSYLNKFRLSQLDQIPISILKPNQEITADGNIDDFAILLSFENEAMVSNQLFIHPNLKFKSELKDLFPPF